MHYCAANDAASKLITVVATSVTIAVLLVTASGPFVHAENGSTSVNATICDNESTATITVPDGDSTVNKPDVVVSGTIVQAYQAEVYVDGQFDRVVSTAKGGGSYKTQVSLTPGTHTLKVVAIHVCGVKNGEASAVVSFEPPPTPAGSSGSSTPTQVGGVVVSPPLSSNDLGVNRDAEQLSLVSRFGAVALSQINTVERWLNLKIVDTATPDEDVSKSSLGGIRAIFLALAVVIAIFGEWSMVSSYIATIIAKHWPGSTKKSRVRSIVRQGWFFRLFGVVFFFLLLLV